MTAQQLRRTAAGAFTVAGDMTSQCFYYSDTAYSYTATLLTNGKVLFVGSGEDMAVDVELYDPAPGTFGSFRM